MPEKNNEKDPVDYLCDIFEIDKSELVLAYKDYSTETLIKEAMDVFWINYYSETQGGYSVGGYKHDPTYDIMVKKFIEYVRRLGNPSKDNIESFGDVLFRLAVMCERLSPADCVSINQIAIELGKSLRHDETVSGGLCNIGSCLSNHGKYEKALLYFRNALQVFGETGEDYYLANILKCFRVTRTKMFFEGVSIKCGQCGTIRSEYPYHIPSNFLQEKCQSCGAVHLEVCSKCQGKGRLEVSRFLDECQNCSGRGWILLPEHTLMKIHN